MEMHVWEQVAKMVAGEPNLRRCKKCGVDERYPTQECCKRPLTELEKDKVSNQMLDYKNGRFRDYHRVLD